MASKNEQKIQEIVDAMTVPGIIGTGAGNKITGNQIASTIRNIPRKTSIKTVHSTNSITFTAERGYYPNDVSSALTKYFGVNVVTPGASDIKLQTQNKYVAANITIRGDADLIPANIRSGVNIFDVTGTYSGTQNPIPYVIGSIKSLSPASIIYYNTTDNYNVFYSIMQYAENTNEKVPLHSLLVYASANSTAPPYYSGLNLLKSSSQSTPRIFVFEVNSDFSIEG